MVDNLFTKWYCYSQVVTSKKNLKKNQQYKQSIILSFLFKL